MRLIKLMNNFHRCEIEPDFSVWFSYETPIAYEYKGQIRASHNYWGVTTGKHLKHIEPNKGLRVSRDIINAFLEKMGVAA